jgi:hypothetical protein
MFVLHSIFGDLLSEMSPQLKKQLNILFFFTLAIYKGMFTDFILLSLVYG